MAAEARPRFAGAVVAVDHGASKTGLAAADSTRIAVSALGVERSPGDSDRLLERVVAEVGERAARTVLVGLPVRASGEEGERAPAIRAFAGRLAARLAGVAVLLLDEALTSKAADERMRDAGVHRSDRGRWRDSYAALVLLEDWLSDGGVRGEAVDADPHSR